MALGPEDILHLNVARFLRVAAPTLLWWHTPNGGKRHAGEARKFKDMGARAGVADLCFVTPEGKAAFIELKAGKGRQSPGQVQFQTDCQSNNAPYAICRSIEEVASTLHGWGVQLRARAE